MLRLMNSTGRLAVDRRLCSTAAMTLCSSVSSSSARILDLSSSVRARVRYLESNDDAVSFHSSIVELDSIQTWNASEILRSAPGEPGSSSCFRVAHVASQIPFLMGNRRGAIPTVVFRTEIQPMPPSGRLCNNELLFQWQCLRVIAKLAGLQ